MQVYDHIQSLPIKYFDNMPAGSVVSRITSDVNQIRTFFVSTFVQILIIVLKIIYASAIPGNVCDFKTIQQVIYR